MKKQMRGLVLAIVCGVAFMMYGDGWTAEAPPTAGPVAVLLEPVGEVLEDIAWVYATANHVAVPAENVAPREREHGRRCHKRERRRQGHHEIYRCCRTGESHALLRL